LRKYIDSEIKGIAVINKAFKPIWELTYKIVSGEENESVKVVNKDPHNLLLSWIPSGKIYCEELKVSKYYIKDEMEERRIALGPILSANYL
jgi:hypothetical protein